ncbi:MAG: OmpA family protein [Burkholderiales bacterium]
MITKSLIGALAFAVLSSTASAQVVLQYREGDRVDPRDVARILGKHETKPGMRMRSIRITDGADSPGGGDKPQASSLSLPVQFAFDSAQILPQARAQLDAVAEGIKLLPEAQPVVIEGHTDAQGPDQYNLDLSNRRALSVRSYLARVHGINEGRLRTEAHGEYKPLNTQDPTSAENRRVQFRGG